jgi:hypothetical protein
VHDLTSRARRTLVADLVYQERVSVVCLQETKLFVLDDRLILELLGSGFDYNYLLAVETRGGILVVGSRILGVDRTLKKVITP